MNESTIAFEIIAEMFYQDTGIIAPGKSVAPEMAMDSVYQDGTRESEWSKWKEKNKKHTKAVYDNLIN